MKKRLLLSFIILACILTACTSQSESETENEKDIVSIAQEASAYFENVSEGDEHDVVKHIGLNKITCSKGVIFVDGESSGVKTPFKEIYDEVKELYMSGKWDGKKTIYKKHTIELEASDEVLCGYILIDGNYYNKDNLDLPSDMDFFSNNENNINSKNYQYIPGEGTYIIQNCKLVKYLRGERIDLQGNELIPEKIKDLGYNYDPTDLAYLLLLYDDVHDGLFLQYHSSLERTDPGELYVFKDYNMSDIQFVDEHVKQCWIDEEEGILYSTQIYNSVEEEGRTYDGYLTSIVRYYEEANEV